MSVFDVAVVVPGLAAAIKDLDHANSPFDKSTSGEAGIGELTFAVEFTSGLGFFGNIKGILGFGLHAKGDFEGLDTRFKLIIAIPLLGMHAVELVDEVQLLALGAGRKVVVMDVIDNAFGVQSGDVTPLEDAG